jgi:hypothetical protein
MFDFAGEKKLEVAADIADDFFEIMQDKEVVELAKKNKSIVAAAIKNHPDAVLRMLARVATEDGVTPEEYLSQVGSMCLLVEFSQMLTRPEMAGLFSSQGQSAQMTSSGSATVNTEVDAN